MALHRIRRIASPPAETWPPARPGARRSGLHDWLTDRGSLTRRLRQRSAHFELRLLRQGPARALRDEYPLLGLPHGRKVWRREVLLLADGEPRVLGHSVCRLSALRGPWRLLRYLGVKPVGDAVFTRPQTRRSALRVKRLNASHPLLHHAGGDFRKVEARWARRSSFVYRDAALWVSEVFLFAPDATN